MENTWKQKLLKYLQDDTISEIECNGTSSIFIRRGKRLEVPDIFRNLQEYYEMVDSLIKEINPSLKNLPVYLEEGRLIYDREENKIARVHIVLPPITDTPQITIAKKTTSLVEVDDIYRKGSISQKTRNFIKAAIECKLNIVFSGSTGSGKALLDTTLIPTPNGLIEMRNLKEGDLVYSPEGKPTRILKVYYPDVKKAYKMTFNKGEEIVACEDHNWYVYDLKKPITPFKWNRLSQEEQSKIKNKLYSVLDEPSYQISFNDFVRRVLNRKYNKVVSILKKEGVKENSHDIAKSLLSKFTKTISYPLYKKTTKELYKGNSEIKNKRARYFIDSQKCVEFPKKELPIHPYILGCWLGDGFSASGSIVGNKDRLPYLLHFINFLGYDTTFSCNEKKENVVRYLIRHKGKSIVPTLRSLNLINNKHIPKDYIYTSKEDRQYLIAGLIDTDGWVDKSGRVHLEMTKKEIIESAYEILLSLGYRPTKIKDKIPSVKYVKDEIEEKHFGKRVYYFSFIDNEHQIPLKNPFKYKRLENRNNLIQQNKHSRIYIKDIVPVEVTTENFMCFEVEDSSHMFLASEYYIPTGNTTFLEACTKLIPMSTRIGVIEDSPELALIQPNVTYLHSHLWKPGMEDKEVASLDWCVRQINRMRTDLIIVGETRGPEFKEFITAANSGMEGSLTTLHANTPKMALSKMASFIMEASPQPIRAINKVIGSTIDIVVQLGKTVEGRYRLLGIDEVTSMLGQDENAEIATTPLTIYNEQTDRWTDTFLISDRLRKRFIEKGYDVKDFTKDNRFGLPKI